MSFHEGKKGYDTFRRGTMQMGRRYNEEAFLAMPGV